MSSFPKAARQQDSVPKASLHIIVTALKEKGNNSTVRKATSTEPGRPLSARRLAHDATKGHIDEKSRGHHGNHPNHAHTMVDDHLKAPIDHSVHWYQLLAAKKHHKPDIMETAESTLQHLKTSTSNDDVLDRLKEDPVTKLQNAVLMSRIAEHIESVIDQETTESSIPKQARKEPLRSAKSLKRDAAIEKLTRVMNEEYGSKHAGGGRMSLKEQEDSGQVKNEEEKQKEEQKEKEKEEESWKVLNFDGSPARKRERRDTYSVITQRRKASRPNTPGTEQKGKHHLDLIGVLEVVPHAPPHTKSVERSPPKQIITVHASDFIKYGDDVEMLKTLKVESPSTSEPVVVEDVQNSAGDDKQSRICRESGAEIAESQVRRSRGHSLPRSTRPASRPSSQPPSARPSSRSSSARTSHPGAKRSLADVNTWPPCQPPPRPASRPLSARTSRPGTARRYSPFLPMKVQTM